MPFSYYEKLSAPHKRIYRRSDRVHTLELHSPWALQPLVQTVRAALLTGRRRTVQRATDDLCRGVTDMLEVSPVEVEVLRARPSWATGELHGLYTLEPGKQSLLQVWMRTAQRGQVVAFKTYLRTVLHELCHHLDFELLGLPETFHTQGFFRRESSLFHQLMPPEREREAARRAPGPVGA